MTSSQVIFWAIGAALTFWMVGAYNRLVRLRGDVVRQFAPMDVQFKLRQALLHRQIDALTPTLANAGPRLDSLRAACEQTELAGALAKLKPAAADAVTGLRVAEGILTEARARLPVQGAPGLDLADLATQLGATDSTLAFARGQFNAAVQAYNHAVRQFPTLLVAGLFGLHPASTL